MDRKEMLEILNCPGCQDCEYLCQHCLAGFCAFGDYQDRDEVDYWDIDLTFYQVLQEIAEESKSEHK